MEENNNLINGTCEHDFRYSHIEFPPSGNYSVIPPFREVVVCRKCGEIRKFIINN